MVLTFIIPRPLIDKRAIRIGMYGARSITAQQPNHTTTPRTSIDPNRQRCISRIFPRLEEPEERVDVIRLVLYALVVESVGGQMNVA